MLFVWFRGEEFSTIRRYILYCYIINNNNSDNSRCHRKTLSNYTRVNARYVVFLVRRVFISVLCSCKLVYSRHNAYYYFFVSKFHPPLPRECLDMFVTTILLYSYLLIHRYYCIIRCNIYIIFIYKIHRVIV